MTPSRILDTTLHSIGRPDPQECRGPSAGQLWGCTGVTPLGGISDADRELPSVALWLPGARIFRRSLQLEIPPEKRFGLVEFPLILNICSRLGKEHFRT